MTRLVELGDRRVLHPGPLRWLRALGWMLACALAVVLMYVIGYLITLLITSAFVPGVHIIPKVTAPPLVEIAASVVGAAAVLTGYPALVRLGEGRPASELDWSKALPELGIGLALGASLMLATGLVLWITGWAHYAPSAITGGSRAVSVSVQSGVVEEVTFRLVLLRLVWRAAGIWPALAASALFFGGAHLNNPGSSWFAALCIAFEAGVLLAAFYILTGRLWISIGLHAGWNFTQGWLLGSPVSGTRDFVGGPLKMTPTPGVPDWMSGGAFGPEASIGALLICTVVGLWVLWVAWQQGRLENSG